MSLAETIRGGEHAYFDSAVTLLFFLLIGRYLDQRARGSARSAAEQLLALGASAVSLVLPDGTTRSVRPEQLEAGQESWSRPASASAPTAWSAGRRRARHQPDHRRDRAAARSRPGDRVFAGTLNLGGAAPAPGRGRSARAPCSPRSSA